MDCKKCGIHIHTATARPLPHYYQYNCGCYAFDTEEEWLGSSEHVEQERQKRWYASGGNWENYKTHYNIKAY